MKRVGLSLGYGTAKLGMISNCALAKAMKQAVQAAAQAESDTRISGAASEIYAELLVASKQP